MIFFQVLFWLLIAGGSFVSGSMWLIHVLGPKAAPALLMAMGFFFTLSNAMLAMLFKQYNEQPPKDMARERKARMRRIYETRLGLAWSRYFRSLAASTTAVLCAWAMTYTVTPLPVNMLFGIGCVCLSYGVILSVLAVHEVRHSARLTKTLVEELEHRKRQNQALEDLSLSKPN